MTEPDSTEKGAPAPCPFLPQPRDRMSYRDLREAAAAGPDRLFDVSRRYASYLWLQGLPARAILALCRGIYLDPARLPPGSRQPYGAFAWMLAHSRGNGFLGNPRISFHHQAARMPVGKALDRRRAWALWFLSRKVLPDLPADPALPESPPQPGEIARFLDQHGLPAEGSDWELLLRR